MKYLDTILLGDCEALLKEIPDNSIDLILTSPPYADQRKSTYGGISPDQYVDWFLPKSAEFLRVLKPTGTFILNIKERVVNGERHTYVLELILAMRGQGWLWTEEFMWHKKNSHPGKWPNRFRDNWERLIQFNKSRQFAMYQDAVMVPVGDWAKDRLAKLSQTDLTRDESKVGSGFGKNVSNWVGREMVYPNNVLHMATECYNRRHSAAFPLDLPKWFIKLFTQPGDVVLDPFIGSGTTAVAAIELSRHFIGVDLLAENVDTATERTSEVQMRLPFAVKELTNHHSQNGVSS
ncbi:MAG: site-specific DNA-methyltransferase [Anaerolineae bacterium]